MLNDKAVSEVEAAIEGGARHLRRKWIKAQERKRKKRDWELNPLRSPDPTETAPYPLSDEEFLVLIAIVTGRRAWSAQVGLIAAGHDPIVILGLWMTGWISTWPLAEGWALTLTPWGAWCLGVHLGETAGGFPFWQGGGLPLRSMRQGKMVHERPLPCPWRVPDHRPGPEEEAMEREEDEKYAMEDAVTETGQLDVDKKTGKVKRQEVLVMGQRVPIDPRMGKKRPGPKRGKKSKRKAS